MHRGFERHSGRMFPKGDFKYIILGILKDKPCYGYELIKELEERFHGFYAPSPGIVYPTLQMFEEIGYVTAAQMDGKKVYTITEEGKKFLSEKETAAGGTEEDMKKWCNPEMHHEIHKTMRELGEIARLLGHHARKADTADKLKQVRDILSQAYKDIDGILRK
jgi:DNA-binding PadR family transcriptional regulator